MDTPETAPASALPLGTALFDGLTIARCTLSESAILSIMHDPLTVRKSLGKAVASLMERTTKVSFSPR